MIARAVQAHVPAKWVTADTVYGQAWSFRRAVEDQGLYYVVGVPASQAVWPKTGPLAFHQVRARQLIASLPAQAWRVRPAGPAPKDSAGPPGPGYGSPGRSTLRASTGCWPAGR